MYISGFDAKGAMWDPITLHPQQTVLDARNAMIKYSVSRVVIAKNRKPLGLVTEKDIARFLYQEVPARGLDEIRLDEIISKPLVTVEPETDLRACAKLMLGKQISSLLVVDAKNNLKGIFTKTDLATAYVEHFALEHKVQEFMTKKVISVEPDEPIHSALMLMSGNQISRIVVTKNKIAVGIITGRDILAFGAFFSKGKTGIRRNEQTFIPSGVKAILLASDVMKPNPIGTTSDSDLADTAYIMLRNRISGMPVVESGLLKGIVTKTDVVRALASHA